MADYGFKVAKEGYDVNDADQNMAFTSKFYSDSILATGVLNVTTSATAVGSMATRTLIHNLTYTPQALIFAGNLGRNVPYYSQTTGTALTTSADAVINATNIIFKVVPISGADAGTYPFRYYIFEKAI